MNGILLGTLMILAILSSAVVASTAITDTSLSSSDSILLDHTKSSENLYAYYDDSKIFMENKWQENSDIVMFRFFDNGAEIMRVNLPDESGREFGNINPIVIPTSLTYDDRILDPHEEKFFSLSELGLESYDGITGEIVTSYGNVFEIEYILADTDSDGTGDSILDGIGVYLTIQSIGTNGMVYFGEEDEPGEQTDIRAYVEVGDTSDWGIVIGDDDYTEVLAVPAFGVQYQYNSGSLDDVTTPIQNVLGFSTDMSLSGNVNTIIDRYGITFSGTGESIYKLNDYSNQNLFLRGDSTDGIIKIITSDVDIMNESYDSILGYLTYSDSIDPQENSFSVVGGIDSIHTGVLTFDAYAYYNGDLCSEGRLSENYGSVGRESEYPCLYKTINRPSISTTLVKTNNGNYYTITGDSTTAPLLTMWNWYHGDPFAYDQWNDNFNFELYDTLPSVQLAGFSGEFGVVLEFPTQDTYLYVKVDGGTSTIKGESFNLDEDVFFYVDGLPANIAYDISKSGIVGIVGKTSSDGVISLLYNDVDFGVSSSPGGILNIYPDSTSYMVDSSEDFGVGMVDIHNEHSIVLSIDGDDLLYIPQNYIYWVFPVGVEVTNLSVDDISLEYLNKDYALNEALYIPVIPSANTIYATINGEDVEILMRDVSSTTQTKQVPIESSTSSDYVIDGAASTSSNISTSTFLTATHTGTMYANLDFKIGGSVDFTMNSAHTGGFTKSTSCGWHGASSPYSSYSCNYFSTPSSPDSITNMLSLSDDQQSQLTTALENDQVSNLTVEVDVIKNMGISDDLETILVYTSDSAQAYVTSTFSEAGYDVSNQVHITYPETSISENITIDVNVGDMVEFVIRVNLEVSGAPAISGDNISSSSYVQATTELGGGVISVGMS